MPWKKTSSRPQGSEPQAIGKGPSSEVDSGNLPTSAALQKCRSPSLKPQSTAEARQAGAARPSLVAAVVVCLLQVGVGIVLLVRELRDLANRQEVANATLEDMGVMLLIAGPITVGVCMLIEVTWRRRAQGGGARAGGTVKGQSIAVDSACAPDAGAPTGSTMLVPEEVPLPPCWHATKLDTTDQLALLVSDVQSEKTTCTNPSKTPPTTTPPLWRGKAERARKPAPPRKFVQLSDDEILSLYQNAQKEAQIEADWRAIEGPISEEDGHPPFASVPSSSAASCSVEAADVDQYLMALSRILQHKGSVHEAQEDRGRERPLPELADLPVEVCCRPASLSSGGMLGSLGAGRGGPRGAPRSWSRGQLLPEPPEPPEYPSII